MNDYLSSKHLPPNRQADLEACIMAGAAWVQFHPRSLECPCATPEPGWHIAAILDSRGRRTVRAVCTTCGLSTGAGPSELHPDAPVIRSAACKECGGGGCECCSRQCEKPGCESYEGVELHHWAPWHSFADANQWPTSYLCGAHHAEWHCVMGAGPGRAADAT